MGKRLLTEDYKKIVRKTLDLPESDFINYYSNIVDDYLIFNNDLFKRLELEVDFWINWCELQLIDAQSDRITLKNHFGIDRDIYKSFFENQLAVLGQIKLKKEFEVQNFKSKDNNGDLIGSNIGTGFKSNFNATQTSKLCSLLLNNFIDRDTNSDHFNAIFQEKPLPVGFEPIIWIKKAKRGKTLNKAAIFDLLELAGIKRENIDLVKMNRLFAKEKDVSINVKSNNKYGSKHNEHSEFYPELSTIFSQL